MNDYNCQNTSIVTCIFHHPVKCAASHMYTISDENTPYKATKINVNPFQHYGLETFGAQKKYK